MPDYRIVSNGKKWKIQHKFLWMWKDTYFHYEGYELFDTREKAEKALETVESREGKYVC